MKSSNALIVIALLSLALAVVSSIVIWLDVSMAVKVAMFALGFGSGVAVGALRARHSIE